MENTIVEVQGSVVTRLIDGIGYLSSALLSVVISIVIGYESGNYYHSTQAEIKIQNEIVLAQAIQMDPVEFRRMDEREREVAFRHFEFIHQAELLGLTSKTYRWSRENKDRLETIARAQLGINASFSFSSTPGYLEDCTLNQGLNSEQTGSLFQLWYGYSKPRLAEFDADYYEHSKRIFFAVGGSLCLLGLLLVVYAKIKTRQSRKSILNRQLL